MSHNNILKVFTGRANPALAVRIAEQLGDPLGKILIDRFPDGEIRVQINEDVRGRDVFVVQPTCPPVNENIMELLVILDSLKRASAGRVTAGPGDTITGSQAASTSSASAAASSRLMPGSGRGTRLRDRFLPSRCRRSPAPPPAPRR